MAHSSNLKLTPFIYGHSFAKAGEPFRFPYSCAENNKQFRAGYNNYLAKTAGVPKNKEQPLP